MRVDGHLVHRNQFRISKRSSKDFTSPPLMSSPTSISVLGIYKVCGGEGITSKCCRVTKIFRESQVYTGERKYKIAWIENPKSFADNKQWISEGTTDRFQESERADRTERDRRGNVHSVRESSRYCIDPVANPPGEALSQQMVCVVLEHSHSLCSRNIHSSWEIAVDLPLSPGGDKVPDHRPPWDWVTQASQ